MRNFVFRYITSWLSLRSPCKFYPFWILLYRLPSDRHEVHVVFAMEVIYVVVYSLFRYFAGC